jgi:hypothetical protein
MPENAKGALFKETNKKGSQPDWTGNIEFSVDLLEAFLIEARKGGPYKARLAAWLKEGQKGKFLSLSLNAPFDKRGQSGSQPSRRPADDPFE